jgi:hypothetical protein
MCIRGSGIVFLIMGELRMFAMIWVQWTAIRYETPVNGNLADLSECITRIFGSSEKEFLSKDDINNF